MPLRRRDRPMPDPIVEREMRGLHARLDAMETAQRHIVDIGDINEDDSENEAGHGEEVVVKYCCTSFITLVRKIEVLACLVGSAEQDSCREKS
jgi:hypothetical protein